jgi:hypothetical protein
LKAYLTTALTAPMYALSSVTGWMQAPAMVANYGSRNGSVYTQKNIQRAYICELDLLKEDWSLLAEEVDTGIGQFANYIRYDLTDDLGSYTIANIQPHILQAKAAVHDADNPTLKQAMASPHQAEWKEALQLEFRTLEEDLKAWTLVRRPSRESGKRVLPMKWALRLKRYPDGLAKKFKARFCVRGDRQVEGIDYFETWAPVVQWPTVRSMMILATQIKDSVQPRLISPLLSCMHHWRTTRRSTSSSQNSSLAGIPTSGCSSSTGQYMELNKPPETSSTT